MDFYYFLKITHASSCGFESLLRHFFFIYIHIFFYFYFVLVFVVVIFGFVSVNVTSVNILINSITAIV